MGFLEKIGHALVKIGEEFSDDPHIVGKKFENQVEKLFDPKWYDLVEKTHDARTNKERYVESSLNPDLIFRHRPSGDLFAVECKFRTSLNNRNMLEWSNPKQLQRYRDFSKRTKMPVFIVIGLSLEIENEKGDWDIEDFMFNIPLEEAKYPTLYESVFAKYERPIDKPFFYKNGKLS